jgi:hypothetical protein
MGYFGQSAQSGRANCAQISALRACLQQLPAEQLAQYFRVRARQNDGRLELGVVLPGRPGEIRFFEQLDNASFQHIVRTRNPGLRVLAAALDDIFNGSPEGTDALRVLWLLTGQNAEIRDVSSGLLRTDLQLIVDAVHPQLNKLQQPIVPVSIVLAGSKSRKQGFNDFPLLGKFIPNHAYWLTDYCERTQRLTLVDPQDTNAKPRPISVNRFHQVFGELYVLDRRPRPQAPYLA